MPGVDDELDWPPASLGFSPWVDEGEWRSTEIQAGLETCIEGTDRPLTGILFAYLDVVTGTPPSGPMNPTIDLQLRLFRPPRCGRIRFRGRTLRLGRMLYVGEADMWQDGDDTPFGVGMATFLNQAVPHPERYDPSEISPYQPLTGARRTGPGTFELAADTHTPQGTVSGATLGLLAEMAAADLVDAGGPMAAVDELDVRFLHKVKGGIIRACAKRLGGRDGATTVGVQITDVDEGDRLVTYAMAVCRPLR